MSDVRSLGTTPNGLHPQVRRAGGFVSVPPFGVRKRPGDCFDTMTRMLGRKYLPAIATQLRFVRVRGLEVHPGGTVSLSAYLDTSPGGRIIVRSGARLNRGCEVRTYGGVIDVGEGCSVMPFVTLFGHGGITVGPRTIIAPHAVLVAANHRFAGRRPMTGQGSETAPIVIGSDCWIAANAVITAGVTVGQGSVIGAGSIILKDVPDYAVVVGNPGRVVRIRQENGASAGTSGVK